MSNPWLYKKYIPDNSDVQIIMTKLDSRREYDTPASQIYQIYTSTATFMQSRYNWNPVYV